LLSPITHLDRIAQSDAQRIEIDLHPARLPRLGQELDIGEGAAHDQQGVAILQGLLRRFGAQEADAAGGVGAVVRHRGLAQQGLDDRRAQQLRDLLELVGGVQGAAAGQDGDLLPLVEDLGRLAEIVAGGERGAAGEDARLVMGPVARRPLAPLLVLDVGGEVDVRDRPVGDRRAAGQVGDIFHMGGPHHPRVVDGDVLVDLVEVEVLLGEGVDQIVIMMSGDREHRLAVHFGVIEAVEQMDAARAGGGQADAELAGVLGVAARHERGGLLMAHLDEADQLLALPQRLDDAVDAVSRDTEDGIHSPVDQVLHQDVAPGLRHRALLSCK